MYANIIVINYISRYTHIIHIYPLLYERFFAMENTHFSSECDKYGEEVDRLTIQKDYDGLESYITELETFASSHNTSEYAPIFYYLGNAYATLADYKKRVKKHNEETAHRKLVLYYLRQALSHVKDCTMLNQLKEEYIYSRLLCYEGIEKLDSPHYADKHVKLSLSSFDYVNYSIRLEQLKSAFKTLYSIFDQVAFMINEYWKLGLPERKADAYNVFRKENFPTNNIALSALYWSHLEFMENFGDADNPSEKSLKTLRHAIEHKFVKIHEYPFDNNLQLESDSFYHISEQDLKEYVLRLLELSREWIMELVYAISLEESKNKIVDNSVSLHIRDYEDDWKT